MYLKAYQADRLMQQEKIKLLIADDHAILRQGLRRILEAEPDMAVVAEAATGIEAVKRAKQLRPDVVIMDVSMPDQDGIESMRQIVKSVNSRVLILTIHLEHEVISEAVAAGAAGYLLKDSEGRSKLAKLSTYYTFDTAPGGVVQGQITVDDGQQGAGLYYIYLFARNEKGEVLLVMQQTVEAV